MGERAQMHRRQRKRGVSYTFNGFIVVIWRLGHDVWLADTAGNQRRITAQSVPEALSVIDRLWDLALKADQFGHKVTSVDYVADGIIALCEGGRWVANRKRRTAA